MAKTAEVVPLVAPARRMRPSPPASISLTLQFGVKTEITEDGSDPTPRLNGRWFPPPATAEQLADATAALEEYEVWLAPARKEWLSARMKALFARFWIADLDASTHGFVFNDTLFAVREFPEWAIAEVCHEWIATKTTRPHAAELVGRCRQLVGADAVTLHNLRRFVDPDEQHQAPRREAERRQRDAERQAAYTVERNAKIAAIEAQKRREAEAFVWRAENPNLGRGDPQPSVRPLEREPASTAKRREVADELAIFQLRDENDPGVQARLRNMGVSAPESGTAEVPVTTAQSFTSAAARVIAGLESRQASDTPDPPPPLDPPERGNG
jgi:hypothetical protein